MLPEKNGLDIYKETRIKTASRGQLVVILYDAVIKFLNISLEKMDQKKYDEANINILKAQNVITELLSALNINTGDEISNNIFTLYQFFKKELMEANRSKNQEKIKTVISLIKDLREAWDQISATEIQTDLSNNERRFSMIC